MNVMTTDHGDVGFTDGLRIIWRMTRSLLKLTAWLVLIAAGLALCYFAWVRLTGSPTQELLLLGIFLVLITMLFRGR